MTRGPASQKALNGAFLHATLRGTVYFLNPERESPADFQIVNRHGVTFISARTTRCLHISLAEMETEYREAIFRLRAIPISPSVYRELWVCSRYGRWRFFEIRDKDIIELAIPVGGG